MLQSTGISEKRIQYIKDNLGSWADVILDNNELLNPLNAALDKLKLRVQSGARIIPDLDKLFEPFSECPLDKLQYVLIHDAPTTIITTKSGPIDNAYPFGTDIKIPNNDLPEHMARFMMAMEMKEFDVVPPGSDPELRFLERLNKTWNEIWGKPQANRGALLIRYHMSNETHASTHHIAQDIWGEFINVLISYILYVHEVPVIIIGDISNKIVDKDKCVIMADPCKDFAAFYADFKNSKISI